LNNPIKLYRIVKTKWQSHALDGEGARLFGGRWNSKGKACVYCASSESLAQLEMLVHIQSSALLCSYSIFELHINPAQVSELARLPSNWQAEPAPPETAILGDQWLAEKSTVALKVPSVIVPREPNYLLNPLHADFHAIVENATSQPINFDERLK
jgi:RES domain-containing protein